MKLKSLLVTTSLLAMLAMSASAIPITINGPLSYDTFRLVGTYDGKLGNSSVDEEIVAGQAILDGVGFGDIAGPVHLNNYFDFAGTLTLTGASQGLTGIATVPTGYDYALAKYDGQNAGYVLFYFGGNGGTIPTDQINLWSDVTGQYALSHLTVFNGSNEINPTDGGNGVPDSGSTITLLGLGMVALGLVKQKLATA
jgi:hypothetical protein